MGNFGPLLAHADRCWKAEEENARRVGRRTNLMLTFVAAFLALGFPLAERMAAPLWADLLFVTGMAVLMAGAIRLFVRQEAEKVRRVERDIAEFKELIADPSLLAGSDETSETDSALASSSKGEAEDETSQTAERQEDSHRSAQEARGTDDSVQKDAATRPRHAAWHMHLEGHELMRALEQVDGEDEGEWNEAKALTLTSLASINLATQNTLEEERIDHAQRWIIVGLLLVLLSLSWGLIARGLEATYVDEPVEVIENSSVEPRNGNVGG